MYGQKSEYFVFVCVPMDGCVCLSGSLRLWGSEPSRCELWPGRVAGKGKDTVTLGWTGGREAAEPRNLVFSSIPHLFPALQ